MQRFNRPFRNWLFALLLLPVLLGAARTLPAPQNAVSPVAEGDPAARYYTQAAIAMRRGDCRAAVGALAPLSAGTGRDAAFARLVSGLHAHACEQVGLAEERLFGGGDPGGPLEDWRLYVLSDSAAARGHRLVARAALAKLLGDYPASPLRPRALVKAVTLAWEEGDTVHALELIGQARAERVAGPEGARLESLAWEIGGSADSPVRRYAARRLLTLWPSEGAKLKAAEIFRSADGSLDWSGILSAGELVQRARALVGLGLLPSAVGTLDSVPTRERDLDWSLLKAEVLTRDHRGLEALSLLATLDGGGATPVQRARLEWERASAAADVATAQRGRANLSSAERASFRKISHDHLRKVVEAGGDRELSVRALRTLYSDYAEQEAFERSTAVLRELRRVDPTDTTGAANLWELGWREFGRRDYTGAIGYWTELYALYPEDRDARRGRYWAARAFEALGEAERAQQIYDEVAAADTTDFYRKNALVRLRSPRTPAAAAAAAVAAVAKQEPWPDDPGLSRARLLSDLGLDELAREEIELVRARAEPRAVTALEALILARKGDRRKSVLVIRNAFPALGGAHQARLPEQARKLYYPLAYQDQVRTWAKANELPVHLVYGIIRQESAFDPQAESWAGARGLMQLMPATARELSGKMGMSFSRERLSDPEFNLRLGTSYFRQVYNMFDGNLELSLAGYNAGPYRIKRLWRESKSGEVDRFLEELGMEEPKTYVKRILVLSDSYRQLYPTAG